MSRSDIFKGIVASLLAGCPLAASAAAYAEAWFVDPPTGATLNGLFGQDVALANGVAYITAPRDNANGNNAGAVYAFDVDTGVSLGRLTPDQPVAPAAFGAAIAIDGNTALVGANTEGVPGTPSGAAYVYDLASGTQLARLAAGDYTTSNQSFGFRLAVDDGTAAIGSFFGSAGGEVHVIDLATGAAGPTLRNRVQIDLFGDAFGTAVAIEGDTVVVGAFRDDDRGRDAGAVYLFDATTGALRHKLLASDAGSGDFFGSSVAIDDGLVAVGSPLDDDLGDNAGAVYVFDAATGQELGKWHGNDIDRSDGFGGDIALDGGVIAARSTGQDTTGGTNTSNPAIYVLDARTGAQYAKLLPFGTERTPLGPTIAIDGDTILAGAHLFTSDFVPVSADYNGNGRVDAADYTVWRDRVAGVSATAADGNGDLQTDGLDYTVWRNTFGALVATPPSALPEPATAWLAGIAVAFAGRRRVG